MFNLNGDSPPIRVDSIEEEYAYLAAYPSGDGTGEWRVRSQTLSMHDSQPLDRLEAAADDGRVRTFVFDIGSFFGTPGVRRFGAPTTQYLDALLRRADACAKENGVEHPGSMPRFPIPSSRYPGRIDVPMAILATDDRGRGLFAPARVVTLDGESGDPVGVGHFPGFDPDDWPPPRLGDWPPAALAGLSRARLAGIVGRFSAVATRLYDTWHSGSDRADYPQLAAERREYVALLRVLDVPGMDRYYEELNPHFWAWLTGTTHP